VRGLGVQTSDSGLGVRTRPILMYMSAGYMYKRRDRKAILLLPLQN
jgi:hypothetical protein